MNILLVNPHFPTQLNHGGDLRMINIYKYLSFSNRLFIIYFKQSELENDYLLNSPIKFIKTYSVKQKCFKRNKLNKFLDLFNWNFGFQNHKYCKESFDIFRAKIVQVLIDEKIDLIHCHTLDMAQYVYDIDKISKFLDIPDCRSLALKRIITYKKSNFFRKIWDFILFKKLNRYESRILMYFNLSTSVSSEDAEYLKKLNKKANVRIIPNGVDIDYYNSSRFINVTNESNIIFWGNMDFPPNEDAVVYFCKEIFPRLLVYDNNIRFYIIGGNPTKKVLDLQNKNIIVKGFVEDIRIYVNKAKVCVIPMRLGSGIKNKILEAMAMRIPVVSTTIGAFGVDYYQDKNIVIADLPDKFANKIYELLQNNNKCKELTEEAFKLIKTKYHWESVAKQYQELFEKMINE